MKDKLLKQAGHEYNPKQRLLALMCLAPIFLLLIPYGFVSLGFQVDQWLLWLPILVSPINIISGLLLILPGLFLAMWSIYSQFTIGRGTPVPLMATQMLIVQPPFTYCRNPMALGSIMAYLGVAVAFRSIGAIVLVLFLTACLLTYIKRIEEMEMELRFGQAYLEYKKRTPFLFPIRLHQ
jgi:protein-S-isoprenylcysteine O-methyltransferase Ste14